MRRILIYFIYFNDEHTHTQHSHKNCKHIYMYMTECLRILFLQLTKILRYTLYTV